MKPDKCRWVALRLTQLTVEDDTIQRLGLPSTFPLRSNTINIYKYIFYRIYIWQLKHWGAEDLPKLKALMLVNIIVCCNIFTIGLLLEAVGSIKVTGQPKSIVGFFVAAIAMVLYFLFYRQKKFENIEQKFKNESSKQRMQNTFLMWLFIVGSVTVNFFILSFYR